VVLVDPQGTEVDRVNYTGSSPWPNPTGASMELVDAGTDNNVGSNWAVAVARGGTFTGNGDLGTPGAANSVSGGAGPAAMRSVEPMLSVPDVFELAPAAPNPFQSRTTFAFSLPERSRVSIRIFDIQGRQVATLVEGSVEAGRHQASWDGRSDEGAFLSSGVFFVRMEAGDFARSRRIMMVR